MYQWPSKHNLLNLRQVLDQLYIILMETLRSTYPSQIGVKKHKTSCCTALSVWFKLLHVHSPGCTHNIRDIFGHFSL